MARYDNLNAHVGSALHDGFEIVHLEPQQHPVAVRFVVAVADSPVMMFYFEAVQLKNKLAL